MAIMADTASVTLNAKMEEIAMIGRAEGFSEARPENNMTMVMAKGGTRNYAEVYIENTGRGRASVWTRHFTYEGDREVHFEEAANSDEASVTKMFSKRIN